MDEDDIWPHWIEIFRKYVEYLLVELDSIVAECGSNREATFQDRISHQPGTFPPLRLTDESSEVAGLALDFIRAFANEARQRFALEDLGARPALSLAPMQGLTRSGDLASMNIEDWAGSVAGSTYLNVNFRIPRSTLHRWSRCNEVIALRKGRERHVFPLAQFVDGRPASGIREVLAHIPNPRMAWFWMISPSPNLNGRTPIELLREDLVNEVISAARAFSETVSVVEHGRGVPT